MARFFRKAEPKFDIYTYWNKRYLHGENSGKGSYGSFAEFKAEALSDFVSSNKINSISDLGCGDGANFKMIDFKGTYNGYDVSDYIINFQKINNQNPNWQFYHLGSNKSFDCITPAELTLSMDVILHLVNDEDYEIYMKALFNASTKFVGIFNTSTDISPKKMARHNKFRDENTWIMKNRDNWLLEKRYAPSSKYNFLPHTYFSFWKYR